MGTNKAQGPNSANLAIEWLPMKMKSCSPYRHIAYGVKGFNAMVPTSDWHLTSDILIDVRSSSSVMQQWHSDNSLKTEESWKSENHFNQDTRGDLVRQRGYILNSLKKSIGVYSLNSGNCRFKGLSTIIRSAAWMIADNLWFIDIEITDGQ